MQQVIGGEPVAVAQQAHQAVGIGDLLAVDAKHQDGVRCAGGHQLLPGGAGEHAGAQQDAGGDQGEHGLVL